ncbi:hypothetical protein IAQ61_008811 [Plenodomus lingam]|uniref:uncharacterized protein n=1 Tax=Leptosphaeria maculans TaxID=5022 RepID=UPI00332BD359|nr:hypothetical protein IAQ61_008811 [Plenodomus lingam]
MRIRISLHQKTRHRYALHCTGISAHQKPLSNTKLETSARIVPPWAAHRIRTLSTHGSPTTNMFCSLWQPVEGYFCLASGLETLRRLWDNNWNRAKAN